MAPRNGGVANVASTSTRTEPLQGMSVRDRAHAIGTPKANARTATLKPSINELTMALT